MSLISGTNAEEQTSGSASAPVGRYGKILLLTEYGAVAKNTVIVSTSTPADLFPGDPVLIAELEAYISNAGTNAWMLVRSVPVGQLTAANLDNLINDAQPAAPDDFEFIGFNLDADSVFCEAVKAKLTVRRGNKERYKPVYKFRNAVVIDLEGLIVATEAAGAKASIPLANNPLVAGDEVIIVGSANYDGTHLLDPLTDTTKLVLPVAFVAETFAAGASFEESPLSYSASFLLEFGAFSDKKAGIIAPTTEANHLGIVAGVLSKAKLHEDCGWTKRFALIGATINEVWKTKHQGALDGLMNARALVLKKHKEDKTKIFVNRGTSMAGVTDDYDRLATARLVDKALYEAEFYTSAEINSHEHSPDPTGATALAQIGSKGLKQMRDVAKEITEFTIAGAWVGVDSIKLTVSIIPLGYATAITTTVTVTKGA